MTATYRHYFDIDPDFFPAVDATVIKKNPDLWKKFYPHDSFVKLLKDTINVLTRKQNLNIWVQGAYGTGKSYAVHTLKCLLDANEDETRGYFETFNLDSDLCNKFISAKSLGKVVTVHRYGSSSINGDTDLFLAIQESVEAELVQCGIDNQATVSMREAVIKYLSDEENKQSFSVYVKGSYASLFGGDDVDDILDHLQSYENDALQTLMGKVMKVAREKQIKAFSMDEEDMSNWLTEVIDANNLAALIFIWDEFQEYFDNNKHHLTGFQKLLQLSQTEPFCFITVTHINEGGLSENDPDRRRIFGRYISPRRTIELPDNMAFQLIGQAMRKKNDAEILKEWTSIVGDLEDRTYSSRKVVKDAVKIDDEDLANVLPLHPYAVSVLKHISTSFESNQRSMFDFIKNDRGEEIPGFQWFIDNVGPYDDNPLLTIDQLWGFFYDKGKENLAHNIRMVLDNYPRLEQTKPLDNTELRVLKAILLFQAISMEVGDSVELFHANEKNLNNAFEGSDLENGEAVRCANKLERDNIIYKKKMKDDQWVYAILTGEMDSNKIDEHKKQFEQKNTSSLILEGNLADCIQLPPSLQLRYIFEYASANDFEQKAAKVIQQAEDNEQRIYALMTFAKNEDEAVVISKKIEDVIQQRPSIKVLFIDTSMNTLGDKAFFDWVDHKATSTYFAGKDNDQSRQYASYANEVLKQWRGRIADGHFRVYTATAPTGENIANADALIEVLLDADRKIFYLGLEGYKVHDPMWTSTQMAVGVECGATQTVKGTYQNNKKLQTALDGAWEVSEYWKSNPSLPISRIKVAVDTLVQKSFEERGRVSIRDIYEMLKEVPYGFLPCNFSAFAMGFLLKEYVVDSACTWSNGTSSDLLTMDKFKDMVAEVIKLDNTPNSRYIDKYIVTMTVEEKSFIDSTALAFGIDKRLCPSVEDTRERIRARMKELGFPIWTLSYVLSDVDMSTDKDTIEKLIGLYGDIANNIQSASGKTDSDIALEIGTICIKNTNAANDLKKLFTKEMCTKGMTAYLGTYNEGELAKLAEEVKDDGTYVNAVRSKFDADAANWVWRQNTVNEKIDEVITEYRIMVETGKLFSVVIKSYAKALEQWTGKVGDMRLCYQAIKDEIGGMKPLLSKLYELQKGNRLQETEKVEFLRDVKEHGENFKALYANQMTMFTKVADFYLTDLNDSDKEIVFKKLSVGMFTYDKANYFAIIEQAIADYKKGMGSQKLRQLWQEKTGTESPYNWSAQYRMPIMAMVPEEEQANCRKVFNAFSNKNTDASAIQYALSYLNETSLWNALNSSSQRDDAFKRTIIGKRHAMLSDIEAVKDYLSKHITDAPYYWLNSSAVSKRLDEWAESTYNKGGYQTAFSRIDAMPADKVKQYLKELIKNNMWVGIEIINDK